MPTTSDFVTIRVKVGKNESRAEALHRAVDRIPFPCIFPNLNGARLVNSEASIPLVDTKIDSTTYLVKYE